MRLLKSLYERRDVRFTGWADLLYSIGLVLVVAVSLFLVGVVGR